MSTIKQGGIFTTNKATINGGGGGGGVIVGLGAAAALVVFAGAIAALIGAALALVIIVIGSTIAGAIALSVFVNVGLKVAYYRRHGELAPRQPFIAIDRSVHPALEAPLGQQPMTVTDLRKQRAPWA